MEIRINKFLAENGFGSRRAVEKLILNSAVKVNGEIVKNLATKVDPQKNRVEVDGEILEKIRPPKIVAAFHKPVGFVCSTVGNSGEKTIFELLPENFPRVFSAGRLDKNSSGLLILTNDGELAAKLTHPRFAHRKKYFVETFEKLTDSMLAKMSGEIKMLGGKTRSSEIEKLGARKFSIILREGKNRQIRRTTRRVGAAVKKLKRIAIGELNLSKLNLPPGGVKILAPKEIEKLLK